MILTITFPPPVYNHNMANYIYKYLNRTASFCSIMKDWPQTCCFCCTTMQIGLWNSALHHHNFTKMKCEWGAIFLHVYTLWELIFGCEWKPEKWCAVNERRHATTKTLEWSFNNNVPVIFHWKTRPIGHPSSTHAGFAFPPGGGGGGHSTCANRPAHKGNTHTQIHTLTVTEPFTFQFQCNKYSNEHLRDDRLPSAVSVLNPLSSLLSLSPSSSSASSSHPRSSPDHTSGMLRQRHFCKQRDKDEPRVDADRVKLMDELIQATQMRRPAILYTTRCWYRKSASASWKSKIILSWQCFSHSNDHKYEWMALGAIKAKVQLAVKCVNESVWSIYIPCRPFSPL